MPRVGQKTATVEPAAVCTARLAINVDDIQRLSPENRRSLLGGRLRFTDGREDQWVRVKVGNRTEAAVEFSCNLLEAATVCDVIRDRDRGIGDEPTRVYVMRRDAWDRLPSATALTVVRGSSCVLSEAVFSVEWEASAPVGLDEHEAHNIWVAARSEAVEQLSEIPSEDRRELLDNWDAAEPETQAERADAPEADVTDFGFGRQIGQEVADAGWYQPAEPAPAFLTPNAWPRGSVAKVRAARQRPVKPLPLPMAKTFQQHHDRWTSCQKCELGRQRTQVVLARGQLPCDVLYIGEAPGVSEDQLGYPFAGPAGGLIDQIDAHAFQEWPHLARAFSNLVACFPREAKREGINEPDGVEIEACAERLRELAHLAKPRLVVLVGSLADKWWPRCVPEQFWNGPTIKIMHPAAIKRMTDMQGELEAQRCIVTIKGAVRRLQNPPNGAVQ